MGALGRGAPVVGAHRVRRPPGAIVGAPGGSRGALGRRGARVHLGPLALGALEKLGPHAGALPGPPGALCVGDAAEVGALGPGALLRGARGAAATALLVSAHRLLVPGVPGGRGAAPPPLLLLLPPPPLPATLP